MEKAWEQVRQNRKPNLSNHTEFYRHFCNCDKSLLPPDMKEKT